MVQEVPKTMKALVTQVGLTTKVEEVPVPEINDNEVLVKVVAVALNPTDWKRAFSSFRETLIILNFATQMWLWRPFLIRARSLGATGPATS